MSSAMDLDARLLAAAGADESPVDREEHARLVAKEIGRARGSKSRAADLSEELLKQTRRAR